MCRVYFAREGKSESWREGERERGGGREGERERGSEAERETERQSPSCMSPTFWDAGKEAVVHSDGPLPLRILTAACPSVPSHVPLRTRVPFRTVTERLVFYRRKRSAITAPRTPRRTCCLDASVLITVPRVVSSKCADKSCICVSLRILTNACPSVEREFFIDNLLVRIHFIIEMIWWTGLAPWEF